MAKKPAAPAKPIEEPKVQKQAHEQHVASQTANFGWAVNVVKLNRAKAYVSQTQPGLKGKELEGAVKERYVALKGLLAENAPQHLPKGKARGRVQNMAEDDGSND